jgi:serine/threonine protein kinase
MSEGTPEERTQLASGDLAPLEADVLVGTRLGPYNIVEVIGRGGMGVVYRGEHDLLRRSVALKIVGPDLAADDEFRERFIREARAAAALDHPGIVAVYDAGEIEGTLYMAMQYIAGTDLARLLDDEGALEPARALDLLGQVAAALDAAHAQGLVHRDVKPANVLIREERCYLTDFGLTKHVASETMLTAAGTFVGTIDYMAPERVEPGPPNPRSDVYSLGCMLFEAIVGLVPFPRESATKALFAHLQEEPPAVSAARPDLPNSLDPVIARALSKSPDERPESCSALIAEARTAIS